VGPIGQAAAAMRVRRALAQLRPGHRQVIVEVFCLGQVVTVIAWLPGVPGDVVMSGACCGLGRLGWLLAAGSGVRAVRGLVSFPRVLTALARSVMRLAGRMIDGL
jgi:hypothetical protein